VVKTPQGSGRFLIQTVFTPIKMRYRFAQAFSQFDWLIGEATNSFNFTNNLNPNKETMARTKQVWNPSSTHTLNRVALSSNFDF
jgi:hypothetical protein